MKRARPRVGIFFFSPQSRNDGEGLPFIQLSLISRPSFPRIDLASRPDREFGGLFWVPLAVRRNGASRRISHPSPCPVPRASEAKPKRTPRVVASVQRTPRSSTRPPSYIRQTRRIPSA
ncbi:hypothetical protein PUN28_005347 [Cardiocondyla obscurior]|uniref:Uncharacterized protein n=1 Tax=Cardiocondyla obscurior TaxID=286306 RepID=A0AAW2GI98_9HYME